MQTIWQEEYEVSVEETDFCSRIRPSALFTLMQHMATNHGSELGVGRAVMQSHNMVWILSRVKFEMQAYPTWDERIRITTWPESVGGRLFPRHYTFERLDGTTLGAATSLWVIMDISQRRVVRLPRELDFETLKTKKAPMELEKLAAPKIMDTICTRTPRYSDLDPNNHMNNARYVEWICDAFAPERFSGRGLSGMQINYTNEARTNERIELRAFDQGNESFVLGWSLDRDVEVFSSIVRW